MFTRRAKRRRLEEEEDPGIIPSHQELERKAMVERAKVELMKLKVVDLKKELKLFGNPKIFSREYTEHYSGIKPSPYWSMYYCLAHDWNYLRSPYDRMPNDPKKRDYVDWLANYKWLLEGSPFDKLPDELVLKIVKMASREKWNRDFIVASISHVNRRFNRIARDTSLWKGSIVPSIVEGLYDRALDHSLIFH